LACFAVHRWLLGDLADEPTRRFAEPVKPRRDFIVSNTPEVANPDV